MAIPIYVVCKAKAETITAIGCEIPKKEGVLKLEGNAQCHYERLGGVFHYYFKVESEGLFIEENSFFKNSDIEVQINVRSHEGRKTPKLEYLFQENIMGINENKFSLKKLSKLEYGIKIIDYEFGEHVIALDYLRSGLCDINKFKSVPTTSDLNKEIHEYIISAKENKADIYIFGDLYSFEKMDKESKEERILILKEKGPRGIHDVHMNQGSFHKRQWIEDNGMYQDGGVLIHFKSTEEERWAGIFIKFEGQF